MDTAVVIPVSSEEKLQLLNHLERDADE
jgi:hypothetical protein